LKLAILGATGSVGRQIVSQALDAGHELTVLVRSAQPGQFDERVAVVQGDATDPAAVDRTIAGSAAVLSALGHTKGSSHDLLARASSNVISAMRAHGIQRLVVLAPATLSDPEDRRGPFYRFVGFVMPVGMGVVTRDHDAQARLVKESGLDWTIVRGPGFFTDRPRTGRYQAGPITPGAGMGMSRADLAEFMLAAATQGKFIHGLPFVRQ
jgi:putative NADH-flavin reductase